VFFNANGAEFWAYPVVVLANTSLTGMRNFNMLWTIIEELD
jgi:hypothetical protein